MRFGEILKNRPRAAWRYLTVADRPPVVTNDIKSGWPWEPLLLSIGAGEWSRLRLGLVLIDIWLGQTNVCQIYIYIRL